ncbi:MAG: 50S ribosomal protein L6 [Xylanivirga thermophila]|jgi:large subunit ribosomal protein L6|uniref:50S ribosomal protein L6 n=1 Tax=Xylanivirga thermophila TaxID=2496273 RepID=UPI00101B5EBC|nr:50S ribosomal protein L6 [Xylanivirga thermophila]
MSRIGNLPIELPKGVSAVVNEDNTVVVKGPKGELTQKIHKDMQIIIKDNVIEVKRPSEAKEHKSLHGLSRTLIANMVEGVTKGFSKNLEINGVGYRAQKQGKKLVLNVGYSHPIEIEEDGGIVFEVPAPNKITINGIDKQKVGAVAAQIRSTRPPEPYKGKGIKYENERIIRKEGKTGKK